MSTELRGKMVNGHVVLDEPSNLEEGTEVRVTPILSTPKTNGEHDSLSKMLLSFAGTIDGLPEDLALNHDHYLYGVPKKTE